FIWCFMEIARAEEKLPIVTELEPPGNRKFRKLFTKSSGCVKQRRKQGLGHTSVGVFALCYFGSGLSIFVQYICRRCRDHEFVDVQQQGEPVIWVVVEGIPRS